MIPKKKKSMDKKLKVLKIIKNQSFYHFHDKSNINDLDFHNNLIDIKIIRKFFYL